jgi:hypothetical protein
MTTVDALHDAAAIISVAHAQHNGVGVPHDSALQARKRPRDKGLGMKSKGTCNAFTMCEQGVPHGALARHSLSSAGHTALA